MWSALTILLVGWLNAFNADLSFKRYWQGGGGERGRLYLKLHCHHQNDSCIKMGSDESYFAVSLTVWDRVTTQCSQTTTFKERRAKAESNQGPACQPDAFMWGQTGWQTVCINRIYISLKTFSKICWWVGWIRCNTFFGEEYEVNGYCGNTVWCIGALDTKCSTSWHLQWLCSKYLPVHENIMSFAVKYPSFSPLLCFTCVNK